MEEDKMKKQRVLVNKKNDSLQKMIHRVEDSEDDGDDDEDNEHDLQQESMKKEK